MKKMSFVVLLLSAFAACSSGSRVNGPAPSASPSPAPVPADAVPVDKPVNLAASNSSIDESVGWRWIDPDEKHAPTQHDLTNGVLRIKIPTNKDLYGENHSAPRYLRAITGDFQIETRVRFQPGEDYQGAGLLIFKDDNNYMRFERAYGGVGGGEGGIRIDVRKGADHTPLVTPGDIQTEAGEVELKIVRTGRIFTAFWRLDEEAEWREAGEFESDFTGTVLAGVIACNTGREITAEFGHIRLLPTVKR